MKKQIFKGKNILIIILALGIIILIAALLIPRVTTSYVQQGFQQGATFGYQTCYTNTINRIVQDLNTVGYTGITIDNQTLYLAPVQLQPMQ